MVFRNEFSWSKSRDGLFKECRRKYFFNHYGFWNGWIAAEDDRVKRIYYLKKLATKEVWVGSIVHEVIEFVLRKFRVGEDISLSHALAILRKRFDSDFEISRLKEYTGFMSKAHRFFEDEYGIDISDEERGELMKKAETCLTNFFNSDIFMEIRQTPVEDWITLEDFLSFDFEGTQVYLSIDFAMRVGNKVILYDWKTGGERKADYELQLGLYALYVAEKFGIPAENITAKMFYLGLGTEGKVDSFEVDSERLEEVRQVLRESVLGMKKLLRDVPSNEAVEEDFEKSEGYWCSRCNFRKVCLEGWES
ncbi:PD-(D/E)XK nuclease family protein [Candidatus Pacearchaeota archaeon]|nr:PD-(D/E)XK nuclease family protein [Candidatus Pacearchaeota archaeon]